MAPEVSAKQSAQRNTNSRGQVRIEASRVWASVCLFGVDVNCCQHGRPGDRILGVRWENLLTKRALGKPRGGCGEDPGTLRASLSSGWAGEAPPTHRMTSAARDGWHNFVQAAIDGKLAVVFARVPEKGDVELGDAGRQRAALGVQGFEGVIGAAPEGVEDLGFPRVVAGGQFVGGPGGLFSPSGLGDVLVPEGNVAEYLGKGTRVGRGSEVVF